MKDSYILQIETATPVCSVALSKNGKTVGVVEADEPNLHASHLTLFIAEILREEGIGFSALSAVAVSKGPGSYTGLRIGVSTGKGLCYGLDIPLIAIDTLYAMATGFLETRNRKEGRTTLVPMIDARRMEVYMAQYDINLYPQEATSAQIINEYSFGDGGSYVLFGSGADKFETLFEKHKHIHIEKSFMNSASFMSSIAFAKFQDGAVEDAVHFEPYYLKDFVATTPKQRL